MTVCLENSGYLFIKDGGICLEYSLPDELKKFLERRNFDIQSISSFLFTISIQFKDFLDDLRELIFGGYYTDIISKNDLITVYIRKNHHSISENEYIVDKKILYIVKKLHRMNEFSSEYGRILQTISSFHVYQQSTRDIYSLLTNFQKKLKYHYY